MTASASVITVNFNMKDHLTKFLPSIYNSEGEFEVIVSDNCSTDGSIVYIRDHFPQVRVIENGENLGFARGNNIGAQHACADFLIFINPDTTVEPDWMVNLLAPFSDPRVGLTTSKILLMQSKDQINACGNSMHISGITQCRGIHQPASDYTQMDEVPAVSGAAFAIRKQLFDQLGGFDPDFFLYMEETDLSLRARLMGWKCVYAPGSIVYHDYTLRFGPQKVFYQERNRYLMLLKSLRFSTLIWLTPILLLAEAVTWGFVFLQDQKNFSNKLRAYTWILRNRSQVLRKRKAVQQSRRISDRTLLSLTEYRINFGQIANGIIPRLAGLVFNSLFFVFRWAAVHLLVR